MSGIFIWVRHAGRVKDLVVHAMDKNEIILVNAPDHLSEEEISHLFKTALLVTLKFTRSLFLPAPQEPQRQTRAGIPLLSLRHTPQIPPPLLSWVPYSRAETDHHGGIA